jgi:hypothetical protein
LSNEVATSIKIGEVLHPLSRQRLELLQTEMKKLPQVELKLYHHFPQPGVYVRELHIPKGVTTIGKIHKYPCWNILAKGERSTLIDGRIERIAAPHVHWTPAGTKRISYTHEYSIWLTVHTTTQTDIEVLERELVAETEEEFQQFVALIDMPVLSACPS